MKILLLFEKTFFNINIFNKENEEGGGIYKPTRILEVNDLKN